MNYVVKHNQYPSINLFQSTSAISSKHIYKSCHGHKSVTNINNYYCNMYEMRLDNFDFVLACISRGLLVSTVMVID